jgi:dimethylaniline monooxygenase (N-oxide forming) / hypotaurine monooxygenase
MSTDGDVLILGGGWSGLMACKYVKSAGLDPVVLEKRETIGGVWAYTDDTARGGVMKNTVTTSSKCITEISDFPMPAESPDFPHHTQVLAYLEQYADHFDLRRHVRLGEDIVSAAKRGDTWHVETRRGRTYSAKRLIVCTGVHQRPADVSGDARFERFSGVLRHSAAVKRLGPEYAGRVVVVWGGGESASDIAYEASQAADRVYFCIPNGQWFIPKVIERWPPFPSEEPKILDHVSSRLRLFVSPTHRYSPFVNQYLQWLLGFNGHGQEAWRTHAPYNRSFFTKHTDVLKQIPRGKVVPKRDVARCDGRTVHFTDGTKAEADEIITCSGYQIAFPFLDEDVAPRDPRGWYKYVFCPEDPTLAFVGFARPIFGSIPGIAELQSRLVAGVFSGRLTLPPYAERARAIDADRRFWNHHLRHTSLRIAGLVDHFRYCDQLARMIGCRPRFGRLLFHDPRRWWRAVTAPWSGAQFWLDDPAHRDRVFATFERYDNNRASQIHVFMVLAPILPLLMLYQYAREALRERLDPVYRASIHESVR